jgi:hypothetical protein
MMTLFNNDTLFVQECDDPGQLAQDALLLNQAMSRNPKNRKNSIFQRPDNCNRCPHSCPVKHLPPQGIQLVGSNCHQDVSGPQDIHTRGIQMASCRNQAPQHVGAEWFHSQPEYLQHSGCANNTDNNTVTTVTQATAAAMTTGSTTATTTIVIPPKIPAAIDQLLANQTAIMSQMAAMAFAPASTQATQQFVPCKPVQVPPIKQIVTPMQQQPFHTGAFNARCTTGCGDGG